VCVERIIDVFSKGLEGKENLFVKVERRIIKLNPKDEMISDWGQEIRHRKDDLAVVELRDLVFRRERSAQMLEQEIVKSGKVVKRMLLD
jgi:hypothetical protein